MSDNDQVDDPYLPGQRCPRWQATVSPFNRFGAAIKRRMEADAAAEADPKGDAA